MSLKSLLKLAERKTEHKGRHFKLTSDLISEVGCSKSKVFRILRTNDFYPNYQPCGQYKDISRYGLRKFTPHVPFLRKLLKDVTKDVLKDEIRC